MSWRDIVLRLRSLVLTRRMDAELQEELDFHLEMQTRKIRNSNSDESGAQRQARLQFGSVVTATEECREQRGISAIEVIAKDLRYAVRTLRKSPVFLCVAVLTLAIGIGANVAIFTLVDAVLFRPLPFSEPARLVRIFDNLDGAAVQDVGMSIPEFEDLRRHTDLFEQFSAVWPVSLAITGGDRAERIEMLGTSPDYFELLGVTAALGTVYTQSDWRPGFLEGVVISDGLWKRQFGSDPHIIGRRVRLDEDGYTIIGVMPPDFRHPGKTINGDVEVWAAAGFLAPPFPMPPVRNFRMVPGAMARLKKGLTLEQAQQRLNAIVAQLQQTYPKDYPGQLRWSARIELVQSSLTGNVRPTLMILLATVGFVLLIVCLNVANLLIARSLSHMREFAVRQALGASRGRLVSQALTESGLIGLLGGAAALIVLRIAQPALLALLPADVPRLAEVHVDWRMALAALFFSLVTGILFGLAPALHASSIDPNRDLKEGGRGAGSQSVRQSRARATLVVLEVAISVVLLIGAGLLIRSFSALLHQEPGFDPKGLTVGQIWVPVPNNPEANRYLKVPERTALARELLRRLAALPGVEQTAMVRTNDVPLLNAGSNPFPFSFPDDGQARQDDHAAQIGAVSPTYFETLKIPLKQGRVFTDDDSEKTKSVVVVNETFLRKFSAARNVIGRRLRDRAGNESEIIGVVGDVRGQGLDLLPEPRIYASMFQRAGNSLAVFVRTRSDVSTIKQTLTQTVQSVDPEFPVFGVMRMDDLLSASMARRRFSLFLMSVFAVLALLLAALGIYGVMAFLVSQRVQEFGIRLALGAQSQDIVRLAFRPGLLLTSIGIAAGLAVAALVTRLLSSMLFGVSARDPLTFLIVPVVLGAVALAACYVPVRRATRISPIQALRCD